MTKMLVQRCCIQLLLSLTLAIGSVNVFAQDYAREDRWLAEFEQGVLEGEIVRIALPKSEAKYSGRSFAAIYVDKGTEKSTSAKPLIMLVHGVGVHPDHGVISILRQRLADQGYPTLSIQMPVQASDAKLEDYYPPVFAEATARIQTSIGWAKSKGHTRVVLLSHSMGSWMSNVYLDEQHASMPIAAWVCMGLTGGYSWTMRRYGFPVLDLMGEHDLQPVVSSAWRRRLALSSDNVSAQTVIAGADHHYKGRKVELMVAIKSFLISVENKGKQ
jgi:pimeloyl-ACP methyl ester carboxylesterase